MFISTKKQKSKLQNHKQLINTKSKRKRNLVKKSIELSLMCDVDVLLIVRDKLQKKITVYESGEVGHRFTVEEASRHFEKVVQGSTEAIDGWKRLTYNNESYIGEDKTEDNL